MRVNLLNPVNPKFGANDLVYGPYAAEMPGRPGSAFNPTDALRRRAGGRLLSDMKIPPGMEYQYSVRAMENAVANGDRIRFDLTYIDADQAVGGYGAFGNSITSMELRYIQENWSRFQNNVDFYRMNKQVGAPW